MILFPLWERPRVGCYLDLTVSRRGASKRALFEFPSGIDEVHEWSIPGQGVPAQSPVKNPYQAKSAPDLPHQFPVPRHPRRAGSTTGTESPNPKEPQAEMVTLEALEEIAGCVLEIMRDTLGKDTRLVVSGGIAMLKHLPNYMQDEDGVEPTIDLIVNSATSASLLRKKLRQHPSSPFVELNQSLLYRPSTSNTATEVRIIPEMLLPYLPATAQLIHEITPSHLPYISLIDLVVLKMDSCGFKDLPPAKQQDAKDAAALLEAATEHCALELNEDQIKVVEECLADILRHSTKDKGWWQSRLIGRCDHDARKPAKEVLAHLIDNMGLDDKSPFPAMVRSPSTSSKASLNSSLKASRSSGSKTSLSSMASSTSCTFVAASSPVTAVSPGLPPPPKDLFGTMPRRPRKFSTSQQSPTRSFHSRKSSIDQKPKRHSQFLGSLPSGPCDSLSPPGLTLTARFESTPGEEKLISSSYF